MSEVRAPGAPSTIPHVTHYGSIQIGEISLECVVLGDDGEIRAYIQKQLIKAIGFVKNRRGPDARPFLRLFAPNYLDQLEETDVPKTVKMPHGGHAKIYEAGILTEIAGNVIDAALHGSLHHKHRHLVDPCMAIMRALAKTGEIALIDEATGYQHHREPDALQDLFGRLIRKTCSDWERRFHPDYYAALYRLFGWEYKGQSQRPLIIGQITDQVVYGAIFPCEIMAEIRERRGGRLDRLHQWLKDGGLSLLEKQIAAVTMIARSSTDYQDFKNRCLIAFHSLGQIGFVFPSQEVAK